YGKQYVMYLEDLIRYNLEYIFFINNYDTIEAHTVKITRDAELDLDDDVSKGFLEKMTKSVKQRRIGDPVRFVYDKNISNDVLQFLMQRMDLDITTKKIISSAPILVKILWNLIRYHLCNILTWIWIGVF